MKLSQKKIVEIARMTRRDMLKAAGHMAIGAAGVLALGASPSTAHAEKVKYARKYKLKKNLPLLNTDHQFRSEAILAPDKTLKRLGLNSTEFKIVSERLRLLNLVGIGMAFQLMKKNKSLRPILLNPRKRHALIFGTDTAVQDSLSYEDAAQIDNLKVEVNAIGDIIIQHQTSDLGWDFISVIDIPDQSNAGVSHDDVDFVCATDKGCQNTSCTDSGCYDNKCTDGGCANLGCNDSGCDNSDCQNDLCNHTLNCHDEGECVNTPNYFSDSYFDDLAERLETAINAGPEMGFLVRVEDQTIRGTTFLDYGQVNQSLRRIHRPMLQRKKVLPKP